jgi:hypothetical protein
MESFLPSPCRGSAALQDAAALAECLQEASALDQVDLVGGFQVATSCQFEQHTWFLRTTNGHKMWIEPAGSSAVNHYFRNELGMSAT